MTQFNQLNGAGNTSLKYPHLKNTFLFSLKGLFSRCIEKHYRTPPKSCTPDFPDWVNWTWFIYSKSLQPYPGKYRGGVHTSCQAIWIKKKNLPVRINQFPVVLQLLRDQANCDNHLYFYSSVINACFLWSPAVIFSRREPLLHLTLYGVF